MKFDEQIKVGSGTRSDKRSGLLLCLALFGLLQPGGSANSELYKYKGENGEWIYTDRKPAEDTAAEVRDLPNGEGESGVEVNYRRIENNVSFIARNDYYAPVEVVIALDSMNNIGYPRDLQKLRWTVPARSTSELMRLPVVEQGQAYSADFRYVYLLGDPESDHVINEPYRAPFSIAGEFTISQAFPTGITHVTPDSYYAVDIAMPEGTDIYAARSGVVFEVATTNFRSGMDDSKSFADANVVRILHDDGTHAIYAHLSWNSIRVKPGDRVARGEFIAESGNTGYSSGPHLHFAVVRNKGLGITSIPVVFSGTNDESIVPMTGNILTAY